MKELLIKKGEERLIKKAKIIKKMKIFQNLIDLK